MKNVIKSLAVLAAFSAASFTAYAGVATGTNQLIFGISDGVTDVLVNLGSINSYAPAGGLAAGTYTIGNYGSLFTTAFGTTSTGLSWGVIGDAGAAGSAVNGDPVKTAWASSAWDVSTAGVLGVQHSTAYDRSSNGGASITNSSLSSVTQAMTGATASQTNAGLKAVTLTSNVWDNNIAFNLDSSLFVNSATSLALGKNYSASDLFTIVPNGTAGSDAGAADSKFDGTFSLDATTGILSFTTFAAIPEPSTYAMILGIATLGFAAIRRRKQANLLA